jgi:hypothetical protein
VSCCKTFGKSFESASAVTTCQDPAATQSPAQTTFRTCEGQSTQVRPGAAGVPVHDYQKAGISRCSTRQSYITLAFTSTRCPKSRFERIQVHSGPSSFKRTNRANGFQYATLGVDVPVRPGQPVLCKSRYLSCILATRPCRRVAGDFLNSNAGRHLHTDLTNTRQHRRRELLSRSNTTAFPRTSGAQTSSSAMAR